MRLQHAIGVTRGQIKKIHAIKNALLKYALNNRPNDETIDECKERAENDYRTLVIEVHGFSGTSKDLSYFEAGNLIDRLEAIAEPMGVWKISSPSSTKRGVGKLKYEDLGPRPGMATPKQLRMIEAMWSRVSFHRDPIAKAKALDWFVFRLTKVQKIEWLQAKDVHTIVAALEVMKATKGRG